MHLWDAATLGVDVIGPVEHGDRPLDETHAAGEVKGRVPLSVTHQGVGISFQEVLDDLVLTRENRQVQRRLCEESNQKKKKKNDVHYYM